MRSMSMSMSMSMLMSDKAARGPRRRLRQFAPASAIRRHPPKSRSTRGEASALHLSLSFSLSGRFLVVSLVVAGLSLGSTFLDFTEFSSGSTEFLIASFCLGCFLDSTELSCFHLNIEVSYFSSAVAGFDFLPSPLIVFSLNSIVRVVSISFYGLD